MLNSRKCRITLMVALAAVVLVLAPAAQASNHKLIADVAESFEINGALFPAGKVALREVSAYSPVATLNEIWVEGRCLGMLIASASGNSPADRNELIFSRAADGHLVLEAVAFAGQPTRELHLYRENASGGSWVAPVGGDLVARAD